MKKRTVGVLLLMVLSFSLFGCGSGNNGETKQEKPQETQEETEEKGDIDTGDFVFYSEIGEAKYLLDEIEFEECDIEFTTQYEVDLWNIEGKNVGHTKTDIDLKLTESGINGSAWCRFKPASGDYEYLYVNRDDVTNHIGEEQAFLIEETPVQEESDPYEEILSKVGYNKDKEYSIDEYIEILTKIFEEQGRENNEELAYMSPMETYDGFHIQIYGIVDYTEEQTKKVMNYMEYAKDGWGGITEFFIVKSQNNEEEGINIFIKIDNEVVEKNMSEWQ